VNRHPRFDEMSADVIKRSLALADDEYQAAPFRGLEIMPDYGERT
jgi:hypothetical protein